MPSAVLSSSPCGRGPRLLRYAVRFVLIAFGRLIAALFIAWAAGALYFDLPAPSLVRTIASLVCSLVAPKRIFSDVRSMITDSLKSASNED
jgi:hypothetical protein